MVNMKSCTYRANHIDCLSIEMRSAHAAQDRPQPASNGANDESRIHNQYGTLQRLSGYPQRTIKQPPNHSLPGNEGQMQIHFDQ